MAIMSDNTSDAFDSFDACDSFKTRFSPSPTGLTHIGTARTALFSYLLAHCSEFKKKGAHFLLRIEDTDKARSTTEFSDLLMKDMQWLHLDWDEGPYYQAQRIEVYESFYKKLLDEKKAYYCFCTETQLQLARRQLLQQGQAPRYKGTCRHLTPEQIQSKLDKGLKPAIRYCIGENQSIEFTDLVQGPKIFQSQDIGDFIIKKNDDTSSFMFCNAVDDALMGVTHVLRGEDHLTNTPRQLLILQSLGLRQPLYGHMAMIVGEDGKPLSKRNGSLAIQELRAQGILPIAFLNYLARLGHHYETDNERLRSLSDLAEHFLLKQISRSPARFDYQQLLHWQKESLVKMTDNEIQAWIAEYNNTDYEINFIKTIRDNILTYQDIDFWSKHLLADKLIYEDLADTDKQYILNAGVDYFQSAQQYIKSLAASQNTVDKNLLFDHLKAELKLKGAALFMPMRIASSGVHFGPHLDKIFELLTKTGIEARLEEVLSFIKRHTHGKGRSDEQGN